MRYMMVVAYDGSKFYGFQRQKDKRSVQGYLEESISKILNEEIIIKGAGRTDRGVHATNQVVHFETEKKLSNLKKKLNSNLKDCYIKVIKKVNSNFHARHSVKEKEYLYKIDLSGKKDANYYLIVLNKLDLKKMKECAKVLIGTHNYKNFVAGKRDDYVSTIFSIKLWKFRNVLYIKFKGIGFYRYMVRNLVGAMLQVAKGKVDVNYILEMLNSEQEKRLTTVSPNGLYLINIKY